MTNQSIQRDRALAFRSLHVPGSPLVLPNAWDTASARIVEDAGAAAVATTSAGLAWALGAADGDTLDRGRALAAVADIAAAVDVPVSADVESGYAKDPAQVADTIRAVLAAGVVGVNIEDALYEAGAGPLRPVAEQASEARWGSPRTESGGGSPPPARPPTRRACRCSSTPASTRSCAPPGESTSPWSGPPPSSPRAPTAFSSPGPSTRGP